MPAVYLAGKIEKGGWRDKIVKYAGFSNDRIYDENLADTYIEKLVTSGPFFIACDHGCYHGEKSHGVGAYSPTILSDDDYEMGVTPELCDGDGIPSSLVPPICKRQIMRSDFVFAYIDALDCYGTLFEIGYAIGRNIPVAVMFSNKDIRSDMWFIAESANIVFNQYGYPQKVNIRDSEIYDLAKKIATRLS